MPAELQGFRLDEALHRGLLHLVVASHKPEETLRAYAALYLEEFLAKLRPAHGLLSWLRK